MADRGAAEAQRLLRPDQAAAAVVLARAGSSAEDIARVLGVSVEVVARSLRDDAGKLVPPEPVPAVADRSDIDQAVEDLWPSASKSSGWDGDAPLPGSGQMVLGPVLVVGADLAVWHRSRPAEWRAPLWVEDDLAWPPSPTEVDRWRVELVRDRGVRERVALRQVGLWGAQVLVDDERRVFCPLCRELVGVVELGRNLFRGRDGIRGGGLPSHQLALPSWPAAS